MGRTIDADALKDWLEIVPLTGDGGVDINDLVEHIDSMPSTQPQRMRGRWVEVTDGICIWKVCDQCGEKPLWNEWKTDRCESNFCPNCGADMMRGEQDE